MTSPITKDPSLASGVCSCACIDHGKVWIPLAYFLTIDPGPTIPRGARSSLVAVRNIIGHRATAAWCSSRTTLIPHVTVGQTWVELAQRLSPWLFLGRRFRGGTAGGLQDDAKLFASGFGVRISDIRPEKPHDEAELCSLSIEDRQSDACGCKRATSVYCDPNESRDLWSRGTLANNQCRPRCLCDDHAYLYCLGTYKQVPDSAVVPMRSYFPITRAVAATRNPLGITLCTYFFCMSRPCIMTISCGVSHRPHAKRKRCLPRVRSSSSALWLGLALFGGLEAPC
jgi:hypothetical protein